jgi:hypothetical protein
MKAETKYVELVREGGGLLMALVYEIRNFCIASETWRDYWRFGTNNAASGAARRWVYTDSLNGNNYSVSVNGGFIPGGSKPYSVNRSRTSWCELSARFAWISRTKATLRRGSVTA